MPEIFKVSSEFFANQCTKLLFGLYRGLAAGKKISEVIWHYVGYDMLICCGYVAPRLRTIAKAVFQLGNYWATHYFGKNHQPAKDWEVAKPWPVN